MDNGIAPYVNNQLSDVQKKEMLQKVQKMIKLLNKKPEMVKKFGSGSTSFDYVPISYVENTLDEIFFGHWETYDFQYMQVLNEMTGSLILSVIHPISGEKIRRVGSASIQIMQDSGSPLSDFTNTKKKNALVMGFPRLKAECFKNAALSIGKVFGKDLRRDTVDHYNPLIPEETDSDSQEPEYLTDQQKGNIIDLMADCDADESAFLKYLEVESLDMVLATSHKKAIAALKARKEQKKAIERAGNDNS